MLQYYNGPTLTIDSYWLNVLLDYGVLGFFVFYGIFVNFTNAVATAISAVTPYARLCAKLDEAR